MIKIFRGKSFITSVPDTYLKECNFYKFHTQTATEWHIPLNAMESFSPSNDDIKYYFDEVCKYCHNTSEGELQMSIENYFKQWVIASYVDDLIVRDYLNYEIMKLTSFYDRVPIVGDLSDKIVNKTFDFCKEEDAEIKVIQTFIKTFDFKDGVYWLKTFMCKMTRESNIRLPKTDEPSEFEIHQYKTDFIVLITDISLLEKDESFKYQLEQIRSSCNMNRHEVQEGKRKMLMRLFEDGDLCFELCINRHEYFEMKKYFDTLIRDT